MKRSVPAVWIVLVLITLGLFLLVDPGGWFAGEPEAAPIAPPETDASPTDDSPPAELEPVVAEPAAESGKPIERQAVDPLVAQGLVSFRVLDHGARPVVGAQVLVVRDEVVLCNERTDVEGEIELAADAQPAGLVVAIEHRPLEWRDVVLDPGRQDVLLAEGGHLSGRFVREDGESPGKLHISIDSDHPFSPIADLPAIVEEALTVRTLRGGYVVLDTDEEGRFDFPGLPEDWSGRFWLHGGWRVKSTSHGDVAPFAGGVLFPDPATDVVIQIVQRRSLRGRLVLRDDGSPLGGALLTAMLRSPDAESPIFTSAGTDEEGRFTIQSRQERITSFDLRLGGRFRECPSLLLLDETSLPADGDLGDVVVDEVRHVPFLLQDVAGDPIEGGRTVAAGTRSATTGKDGRGKLRWIARAVDHLVAEAEGFVPTEREIPAVVVDPLVVTMEEANELVVKLLLPEDSDPSQFKVLLRGEDRITAAPVANVTDQSRHVSERAIHIFDFTGEAPDSFLCAGVNAQTSSATFYALRPGVEITLEVQGITGNTAYHSEPVAPLGPAEHREIEVSLETGMITFRGHVLDEDGNPLVRATVQLGGQILGWTDDDGAFESFLARPETGTLLLGHRTCTTLYLHDYAVPTDGNPVEFRLQPARPLTIEVVDEEDNPVPQAEIYTEYGGFTTNTHRIEGNRHIVSGMPAGPFVIVARLAGREFRQEHDPAVSEARVVVPVHGRVVVLIPAKETAGRTGRFILSLTPPAGEQARPVTESRSSAPNLRIEIAVIHPGTYQAALHYEPSDDEREAGRERISSEPQPVVIEGGKETQIHLALPARDG